MKTLTLLAVLVVAAPCFAQEHRGGHHRQGRHEVAPQPPAPAAMSDWDFEALSQAVRAEPFSDGKLAVVRAAAAWSSFTVAQVGSLVDSMTFCDEKLEVVQLTNPRILDRGNAWQLFGHFVFDTDKEQVGRILGS